MKFDRTTRVVAIVFLTLFAFTSAFRKNRFESSFKDELISNFVNRGFSSLNNDKDILKDVEKILTPKKIFNYDIDVSKRYFGDFYISEENIRITQNRNITNFNTEEMTKNQELTLKGDNKATVGSDVYKQGTSHILRLVPASHIFSDTVATLSLALNHNKAFPNLASEFVEEAYKTFYKMPNANSNGITHTIGDLINDKDTIKAAVKFFTEFGTNYISESLFGFRFGFYQEHKNKTTILRTKEGTAPDIDLVNMSFMQRKIEENKEVIKPQDLGTAKTDEKKKEEVIKPQNLGTAKPDEIKKEEVIKPQEIAIAKHDEIKNKELIKPQDLGTAKPDEITNKQEIKSQEHLTAKPDEITNKEEIKSDKSQEIDKNNHGTSNSEKYPDKKSKKPPVDNNQSKEESSIPSTKSIEAGDNTNPEVNDFSIGQCAIEKMLMKVETCNQMNPRLVRLEVDPIHYLFNPLIQVRKDFSAGGEALDTEKVKKINQNMGYLLSEMQLALDPNLMVVTKIEAFSSNKAGGENSHDCLKIKQSTIDRIHKSYKQTKGKFIFQEALMLKDRHVPVVTIKSYGTIKKNNDVLSKGDEGMFLCITREHNISPEELKNGKWESKKFLADVTMVIDSNSPSYENAGYTCKESWTNANRKSGAETKLYLCLRWTDNFMESHLVTDIKFFEFDAKVGKCTNGFLNTFIDGKSYQCDCHLNLGDYSDDKKQGDVYLCKSRKLKLFSKPMDVNKPSKQAKTGVK